MKNPKRAEFEAKREAERIERDARIAAGEVARNGPHALEILLEEVHNILGMVKELISLERTWGTGGGFYRFLADIPPRETAFGPFYTWEVEIDLPPYIRHLFLFTQALGSKVELTRGFLVGRVLPMVEVMEATVEEQERIMRPPLLTDPNGNPISH